MKKSLILFFLVLQITACSSQNTKPVANNCNCQSSTTSGEPAPVQVPANTNSTETKPTQLPSKVVEFSTLKPAKWEDVDGLTSDDLGLKINLHGQTPVTPPAK
jgi:membrane-bound lytic murein transglycosylase A